MGNNMKEMVSGVGWHSTFRLSCPICKKNNMKEMVWGSISKNALLDGGYKHLKNIWLTGDNNVDVK